ncbi:MAG: protoglobin domain-containing protein [Nannocystaceae bacterium]
MSLWEDLKRFIAFGGEDAATLVRLGPLFEARGGALTDAFYERLAGQPETAALIAGRVDALKATHAGWMAGLFAGEYGDDYYRDRARIGLAHVRAGIPPWWVEAVFAFLHSAAVDLLAEAIADPAERCAAERSLLKILDLDQMVINLAYGEERLHRLCEFTGMSRKLLERCVAQRR